jgi:trimethylamine:corrinoid methyltransferase-like protein
MTDSKMPDVQSGYEKAYNHALVGNAGANLLYESAGMVASLLGFSMEQLIIDNDIIGAIQRTIRGIDVSDEALSLDAIRETCIGGPNHFLKRKRGRFPFHVKIYAALLILEKRKSGRFPFHVKIYAALLILSLADDPALDAIVIELQ